MKKYLIVFFAIFLVGCKNNSPSPDIKSSSSANTGNIVNINDKKTTTIDSGNINTGVVITTGTQSNLMSGSLSGNNNTSIIQNTQNNNLKKTDTQTNFSKIKHKQDFASGFWTDGKNMYLTTNNETAFLTGIISDGFKILGIENYGGGDAIQVCFLNKIGIYIINFSENYFIINDIKITKVKGDIVDIASLKGFKYYENKPLLLRDKNDIYKFTYSDRDISIEGFGADLKTFEDKKYYYKDKNNLYDNYGLVTGADVKSFKIIATQDEENGQRIFKDAYNVYYYHGCQSEYCAEHIDKIDGISSSSLTVLSNHVIKDDTKVMVCGFRPDTRVTLTGADPKTFDRVPGVPFVYDQTLYQDKNNAYYGPLDQPEMTKVDKSLVDKIKSLKSIGGYYYKDNLNIYYFRPHDNLIFKIEGADYNSFSVNNNSYAKDKNHIYKDGKISDGK